MTPEGIQMVVAELIQHLGLKLEIEVNQDGDLFLVNLNGADARLIESGRDNQTMAFLTIVKLLIKKQSGIEPKLILDFNHERELRLKNVAQMAKKTAEMVRLRGGEEELRPMSPAERRAVHMALKEMAGIRTESQGEEPHRRIVIIQENGEM